MADAWPCRLRPRHRGVPALGPLTRRPWILSGMALTRIPSSRSPRPPSPRARPWPRVSSELGLSQSVSTFLSSYQVTQPSDQVIDITLSAPTSAEAITRCNAVAAEFLKVNAAYAQTQQQQQEAFLGAQVDQAQQKLTTIDTQLAQAKASGASHSAIAQLTQQQTDATNALTQIKQSAVNAVLDTRVATRDSVKGTRVINPAAPVHKSKAKTIAHLHRRRTVRRAGPRHRDRRHRCPAIESAAPSRRRCLRAWRADRPQRRPAALRAAAAPGWQPRPGTGPGHAAPGPVPAQGDTG